jgi:hypothetical protein
MSRGGKRSAVAALPARGPLPRQGRIGSRVHRRTHYELARASGITPAQLDRFVAGERDLTLATAAKVADALGLELRPKGA